MRTLRTAAAFAAALAATPAAAQDSLRALPLDTVTVRVLGAPLLLERAPFPVSVVGAEELRSGRAALTIAEALRAIPGVQADHRYNYSLGERISIRGFGARAGFGVRGVRVLVDDLPATLPDGQTTLTHIDPSALGRVEVVRGPASALYGNASGGVIRFTSSPYPEVPLATEHRAVAGAHGLRRVETAAAGRSGAVAWRAHASHFSFDGYRDHQSAGRLLGGGSVEWAGPRDALRLSVALARFDALNPGSLPDSLRRVDPTAAFPNNVRQRTGEEGRQAQLGARWRRGVGAGTVEVTAHLLGRALENPIPNVVIDLDRRLGGLRAAYRGGTEALRVSAGVEAERQRDERRNHRNQEGSRAERTLDQRERVTLGALFAQATASPVRGVELLGALRHDRFRFSVHDRRIDPSDAHDSGSRSMSAWSPALGASVAVAPGVRVYANLATAFETPTTTELANRPTGAGGFNPELSPQRTLSWEGGARARVGRWGRIEAGAYHAAVRHALVPFEVAGAPGRVFFRNAGEVRHRGMEAAAVFEPRPGWSARGAYSWTDARFVRYFVDGVDRAGNRVPGVSPHRLELSLLAAASGEGPFAGIDLRRLSRTPVDDRDDEGRFDSPGYTLVELRAGWEGVRAGGARVAPFGGILNLLDRTHDTAVAVNAFGGRYYEPGPGRSLYLGVRVGVGGGGSGGD